MADRRNEGSMPAEQGEREPGSMMDDRNRGREHEEDVRGIGESEEEFEDTEDAEDTEDTEDTEDEAEEGSF